VNEKAFGTTPAFRILIGVTASPGVAKRSIREAPPDDDLTGEQR
jgi:hypothetical protein